METTIYYDRVYIGIIVPLKINRKWGIWGSYYSIPKAIFYLLKGDYKHSYCSCAASGFHCLGFLRQPGRL